MSDTVGLIEAMKSFHEVKTQEDGTISKFLVENEDAVDAGQDLVRSCLTGQGGSPACLAS